MFEAYMNILVIFAIIFLGYLLSMKKWFNNQIADTFSKMVLNIALPMNMYYTITHQFSKSAFLELFKGMLLPACSILLTFLLSFFWVKLFRVPKTRKGVFQTMFSIQYYLYGLTCIHCHFR